jgi:hypothetical protein
MARRGGFFGGRGLMGRIVVALAVGVAVGGAVVQ